MKKLIAAAIGLLLSACATGYMPEQFPIMHTTAVLIGDMDGGHGSGTVIAGNLVLTAKHVADNGDMPVHFINGTERNAHTVWRHPTQDVAVMQFDGAAVKHFAKIDCKPVEWLEPFAWIGNPSVAKWNLRFGYVSSPEPYAWKGTSEVTTIVAANFNPGDSGSGLISPEGKLRGVVSGLLTADLSSAFDRSLSQSGNGLMVPSSAFCADLVAGLGASISN